jgi:hypothetical protein
MWKIFSDVVKKRFLDEGIVLGYLWPAERALYESS